MFKITIKVTPEHGPKTHAKYVVSSKCYKNLLRGDYGSILHAVKVDTGNVIKIELPNGDGDPDEVPAPAEPVCLKPVYNYSEYKRIMAKAGKYY